MKSEWKTKTVGELTSYIAKGIPPKYTDKKSDTTIVVLNQKCNRDYKISYEQSRLHDTALKKVPDDKMLKYGDVIINSTGTGTAGRIAQASDITIPTTIDGHMIIMRPTEEIDFLYYGYALKSNQLQIESFAEGSTGQTEINRHRLLNELTISYPICVKLQHQIAKILSVIDNKIELNNKINENLLCQIIVSLIVFIVLYLIRLFRRSLVWVRVCHAKMKDVDFQSYMQEFAYKMGLQHW